MYSIEDAIRLEDFRENENSFYDVFEKHTEEEIEEYKRMAGIPITDSDMDFKKSLNNSFFGKSLC